MEKTPLDIVVIDNNGYQFTELNNVKKKYSNRLELISFVESEQPDADYLKNEPSKGRHEFYAIDYARRHSKLLQSATLIIKITGRYFIPNLHLLLKEVGEIDAVRQNDPERCEIVGSHIKHANTIFHKISNEWHVENVWRDRIKSIKNVFILPELKIDPTPQGFLPGLLTSL
jgi:hypothetical protein